MKDIEDMNLAEAITALRDVDVITRGYQCNYDAIEELADRIHDLTRWIPVSERMPTKQDGDENGYIFTLEREKESPNRLYPCIQTWSDIRSDYYYEITHWKRITPPEGL
jgi:hypothetical protein